MKCMIPEISWHNREPVLCIDVQPLENDFYRLATGGSDYHILIWQSRIADNGAVTLDVVSDLTRHQRAVNAVRWSPNGQYLASADDDANIIIWNLKTDNIPLLDNESNDKEIWVITKIMRGHKDDVYDLCWSPDGSKLLSGSIDNTAIIWNFAQGKIENIITDHKGFVQGVCWDPKGTYLATLCSDRICRIFEGNGKQVRARISKGSLPVPESHPLYQKEVKYFHDDTFKSYFRRITFTPDGNMIIAPAACVETEDTKKALSGTYLFTLDCLTRPIAILPMQKQCGIAAKCSPILYELRPGGPDPIVNLPYRMIIAVASESDLILYDTQQMAPIAYLHKIHYTRLTDLAWSMDGRLLAASSTDGFCTLLTFEPGELGIPYTKEESEVDESYLNVSGCEELEKSITESKGNEEKPKKESFLLQWANKVKEDGDKITMKDINNEKLEESKENKDINKTISKINSYKSKILTADNESVAENDIGQRTIETIEISDSPVKSDQPVNKLTPRRIIPIQLSSPANKQKKKSIQASKSTPTKRKSKQTGSNQTKESKPSSLINFLNVTPDKTKTSEVNVSISEESSNARDAWHSEKKDIEERIESENIIDDITETIPDFKLQIEESLTEKEAGETCNDSILIDTSDDVEMVNEKKGETANNAKENKIDKSDCNTDKNESNQARTKQAEVMQTESPISNEDNLKKIPRRIQLITLSSPKHKKQKTTK